MDIDTSPMPYRTRSTTKRARSPSSPTQYDRPSVSSICAYLDCWSTERLSGSNQLNRNASLVAETPACLFLSLLSHQPFPASEEDLKTGSRKHRTYGWPVH